MFLCVSSVVKIRILCVSDNIITLPCLERKWLGHLSSELVAFRNKVTSLSCNHLANKNSFFLMGKESGVQHTSGEKENKMPFLVIVEIILLGVYVEVVKFCVKNLFFPEVWNLLPRFLSGWILIVIIFVIIPQFWSLSLITDLYLQVSLHFSKFTHIWCSLLWSQSKEFRNAFKEMLSKECMVWD